MKDVPAKPDQFEKLEQRHEKFTRELAIVNRDIHFLNQKQAHLTNEINRTVDAIKRLKEKQDAIGPDAVATLKNSQFLRAWGTIYTELKDEEDGVNQRRILWAARKENPLLKDGTFRSYLHRLKKEGRIKKLPGMNHWVLVARSKKQTEEDDK